ncbi:ferric reductase transmembrane component 4 [Patellaria atrata CBS 101060]|uniref:Ferric reductase transmembrane component 4 n=1 Tax=Patellaria atrata CBS 101060 TaxID=1346257 RepID=A0A9P4VQA1_9PEZI|nr:ferric reductase transmembrane component 4 [Patellaria atrata CBS 101060]
MKLFSLIFLCLSSSAAGAFTGMGGPLQEPACAYACRNILSGAPLSCTPPMDHSHGHGHSMPPVTSPACRAGDDAYLTSLAYCINTKCPQDIPIWQFERFWSEPQTTGDAAVPAKWDYRTALDHVKGLPNVTWAMGNTLNNTMLVNDTFWGIQNRFIPVLDWNSTLLFRYSLIILIVGFATPIAITWLSKLPIVSELVEKLHPYVVWPSTIGSYHVRPLPFLLGNPPTLGQAFYIVGFVILNIILSCVGYTTAQPHPWGYNKRGEILAYAGYRTGEFAFALLPLLILFAGRNNILLWLTNWSHSTFILLHRWVSRLFALHTILHSIFLLAARIQSGTYSADVKLPYWQWGIAGTVFVCVMLVFSVLWMRRLSYEVFLIGHIILAVLVVVTSWYHLILRFYYPGNHEYWLYAAAAVWVFDRVIRVLRIVKNGVRRATVTKVGPNHVRIEIPGIRFSGKPGYHGYVYFPTLTVFRPWENHPFSVNSTPLLGSYTRNLALSSPSNSISESSGKHEVAKSGATAQETHSAIAVPSTSGVTLYVRKSTGMTHYLQKHAKLLTLLDGPYPNNPPDTVLNTDRLLLIGGGIGITGLLGFIHAHYNVKLAWSVKPSTEAVVHDLDPILKSVTDREIRIGERLDVDRLLRQEAQAGYKRVGVVVCGPGSLCDDVRAIVSSLARHEKTIFELEVDAFSW